MLPLPAPQKVKYFRVRFRFQLHFSKCFRFRNNFTASASTYLTLTEIEQHAEFTDNGFLVSCSYSVAFKFDVTTSFIT